MTVRALLKAVRDDPFLLAIPALLIAFFVWYALAFPGVVTQDEFLTAQDGILLRDYALAVSKAHFPSPTEFVLDFQRQGIGLLINVYPPLVSGLYAMSYLLFGVSLLSARLVHLAFAIIALLSGYLLWRRQFGRDEARWIAIILFACFSFTHYAGVLQREMPYLAIFLVGLLLLDRYLETRRIGYATGFLAALVAGALTKDFFLFAVPVYGLRLLQHGRPGRRWRDAWRAIVRAIRWDTLTLTTSFIAVCVGYYGLKLGTSGKETVHLFGGFTPVQGIIDYAGFLWADVPVILILAVLACVVLTYRRIALDERVQNLLPYVALLAIFTAVMISVLWKELRYLFVFYPVAVILIVVATRPLRRARSAVLFLVFLLVVAGSLSAISQLHETERSALGVTDEDAVARISELGLRGDILFLTHGFRHDLPFYLRKHGLIQEHGMINAYFEKANPEGIRHGSRFMPFLADHPTCETAFDAGCWDAFIAENGISIVVVDRRMLTDDPEAHRVWDADIVAEAERLEQEQVPVITTPDTLVYTVGP